MKRTLLLLALSLLLTGCGSRSETLTQYGVCFLSDGGSETGAALENEMRTLPAGRGAVDGLMRILLTGPESDGLVSPFPADTKLRGWRVDQGIALIDLTEPYGDLSGVDLTLADSCIVLTLCQLDSVDAVYLTVEGSPRPFRDRVISPADLLLDNGAGQPERLDLTLFFPREGELFSESREVRLTVGDKPAVAAVQALLEGPDTPGSYFVAPENTRLLSLRREKDLFILDLSGQWFQGEEDPLRVLALAATLEHLEPGTRLKLTVEGQVLDVWGGLDLSRPVSAPAPAEAEPRVVPTGIP